MSEDPSGGSAAPTKARPIKVLPTDRLNFNKQLDILRAFAALSGPTSKPVLLREVAETVGMVESSVSMNNAFFTDVGLLTKTGNGFIPSPDVVSYHRAWEWNPETAAQRLSPTLAASWFGDRVTKRLSFQPMEETQAIQMLAQEAAASKDYQRQIQMLIEYIVASGLANRDGGVLRPGPMAGARVADTAAAAPAQEGPPPAPAPATTQRGSSVTTSFSGAPTEGVVQFHVSVKVDMSEFKGWDPARITAFFGGIAQVLAAKGRIEEVG